MGPPSQEPTHVAPPSRRRLADAFDNLIAFGTTGVFCFIGERTMPRLSGRSLTLEERMMPLVIVITLTCGMSLLLSRLEMRGGTLGQRVAGVRRVRLDGMPIRNRDWLYRHWPSLLCIVVIIALYLVAVFEPRFPTTRLAVAWLQSRMTIIAAPCAALIVAGYALRELRPTTIVVWRKPLHRRGFDVVLATATRRANDRQE